MTDNNLKNQSEPESLSLEEIEKKLNPSVPSTTESKVARDNRMWWGILYKLLYYGRQQLEEEKIFNQ